MALSVSFVASTVVSSASGFNPWQRILGPLLGLKFREAAKTALLEGGDAALNTGDRFRMVLGFPFQCLHKRVMGSQFDLNAFAGCSLMEFNFFFRGQINCDCHSITFR